MPNTKLSSLTLWLALFGTAAPFACTASECDGPGGLCIEAPSGDDGEPGGMPSDAGAPGSGGSGGSGEEGGAPQGGSGAEGGSPSPGGADGMGGMADGGEETGGTGAGRGGSSGGGSGGAGSGGRALGGVGNAPSGGAGKGGAFPGGSTGKGGFGGMAGGMGGRVGRGGTGGVVDPLCPSPDAFFDTCGGAGGDDFTGWCDVGTSATTTDELGAGGMGPGTTTYLIDDLEDGDVLTEPVFGGRGIWYVANDGSGLQFPTACPNGPAYGIFPIPGGKAIHTYGRDFTGSGLPDYVAYAQIGLSFHTSAPECELPLDASRAVGIKFRAKGSVGTQMIIVTLQTVATTPPEWNGTCTASCYQGFTTQVPVGPEFMEITIPFSYFVPGPYAFDPATLLNITWSGQLPCFDFWIDDVAFYGYE